MRSSNTKFLINKGLLRFVLNKLGIFISPGDDSYWK